MPKAAGSSSFADPEVPQLHAAFEGDQHVGGLEVAMNDQRAMGVLHGRTNVPEQPQSRLE